MESQGPFMDRTSQLCNLQSARNQFQQQLDQINQELDSVVQRTQPLLEQQKRLKAQVRLLAATDDFDDLPSDTSTQLASFEKEVPQVLSEYLSTTPSKRQRSDQENIPLSKGRGNKNTAVLSRRRSKQLNTPGTRLHDVDLATEIGEGLVEEVRRLQARIHEKDEQLKEFRHEKKQQESGAEETESKIRSLVSEEEKLKSINWELEMRIQEAEASNKVLDETRLRLEAELDRATALNLRQTDQLEALQDVEQTLNTRLNEMRLSNTSAQADHKEVQGDLRGEIAALQRRLENAKADLENERMKVSPRTVLGSPGKVTDTIEESDDGPETPTDSPPMSPIKGTPHRNATLEFDTMKGTLYYNQAKMLRQRKELEKEKSLRIQYQRRLEDTEDELASLKQLHDSQVPRRHRTKVANTLSQRRDRAKDLLLPGSRPISHIDLIDEWGDEEDVDNSYAVKMGDAQPQIEAEHSCPYPEFMHKGRESGVASLRGIDPFQIHTSNEESGLSDSDDSNDSKSVVLRKRSSQFGLNSGISSDNRRNSDHSLVRVDLQTELDGIFTTDSPNTSRLVLQSDQDIVSQPPRPETRDAGTMTDSDWQESKITSQSTAPKLKPSATNHPTLEFVYEDPSQAEQDLGLSTLIPQSNFATVKTPESCSDICTYQIKSSVCRHSKNEMIDQQHRSPVLESLDGESTVDRDATAKSEITHHVGDDSKVSSLCLTPRSFLGGALKNTSSFPEGEEPEVITVGLTKPPVLNETSFVSAIALSAAASMNPDLHDTAQYDDTVPDTTSHNVDSQMLFDHCQTTESAADATKALIAAYSSELIEHTPAEQDMQSAETICSSPFTKSYFANTPPNVFRPSDITDVSATVAVPRAQWDELMAQQAELHATKQIIERFAKHDSAQYESLKEVSLLETTSAVTVPIASRSSQATIVEAFSIAEQSDPPQAVRARSVDDSNMDGVAGAQSLAAKITSDLRQTTSYSPTAKAERILGKSPDRATLVTSKSISRSLRLSDYDMAPPMAPSSAKDTLRSKQSRGRPSLSTYDEIEKSEMHGKSSTLAMPTRSYSQRSLSSISSFASEVDDRFYGRFHMPDTHTLVENPTDPSTIESITRTMIGMSMYKYTRLAARQGLSENRHKRYFWIHPYTKTLYWSVYNPVNAPEGALIKSAPILSFNIEEDYNTMPPGLHQKSICIGTPRRTLKVTAVHSADHEDWIRSLNFLIYGPPPPDKSADAIIETETVIRDFSPRRRSPSRGLDRQKPGNVPQDRSDHSRIVVRSSSASRSRKPSRNTLSGRVSALFSRVGGAHPETSVVPTSRTRELSEFQMGQPEQLNLDSVSETFGLENVRTCCGGRHDVSDLCTRPGSSSRTSSRSRR